MTLRDRVAALEAENGRLLGDHEHLLVALERLTAAVQRIAGVEPPPEPAPELVEALPCRTVLPPVRRYRRVRGGERP